jgi:TM2 domain-containing membrane protein YozV
MSEYTTPSPGDDEPVDPQRPAASLPATYGMSPQAVHPHPAVQVAAKNPGVALLASFFFPGLGSLMNGQPGKGIAIFIGYVISWVLTIILIGFVGVFGFWVWGMVDAYQGAKRWNAAHGIIS